MAASIFRREFQVRFFRKMTLLLLELTVLLLLCACPSAGDAMSNSVVRLEDGKRISFREMLDELQGVDYVLIGELHDSMASHRGELQVIEGLERKGTPLAVGMEMFWAKSQPALDEWVQGKLDMNSFIRLYYLNWGLPWPNYRDILEYAKNHDIPLIGLNIPPAISRKVAKEGFQALSAEERGELGPITCDVTAGYRHYIRQVFQMHSKEKGKSFNNFCEAQVLWDKSMAWHLVQFREEHPDRQVVVLAGLTHALKRGIPSRIKEFSKTPATFRVIAALPKDRGDDPIPSGQADYLLTE
jgi:uncharacterized iron-regulated protein